ncbi:F0F1 ATP synthase subunit epsilon [Legionella sp. PATHC038]|uniref:F0F1 ATP synthase subunit epsilon n=1 Tax=Legionella sheltonii TaxID=2992041 RepID=UPI0022442155|nr:F0F1 ATP synthase subunit epsilon [Legionella sp. PATHC038]MCW8400867.1 F0F1 ATP synthase subunit epsilon [Legionella sp. PATHC038]
MATFTLHLHSALQEEQVNGVVSFVGEDDSGQFGLFAHHTRMMTCLNYGLARFRYEEGKTEYLAIPSGLLYFIDNDLHILTRHYIRSPRCQDILLAIDQQLQREEKKLITIKESIHRLDYEMLKSLLELKNKDWYDL